jgi:WD40 repeat protein
MSLAQRAWEDAQFPHLRELLDRQAPARTGGQDFRGFEWYYWDRLCDTAQVTFWNHSNNVYSVAFSPDGRRVATAGWDGSVRVWDPRTGDPYAVLAGGATSGAAVAYSPDGRLLARAGAGGRVVVQDTRSGLDVRTLHPNGSVLHGLAFAPDGRRLACGADKNVRVWDVDTGNLLLNVAHVADVWGVAFSPDGTRVASASLDSWARVWDAGTGRLVRAVGPHPTWVRAVAYSPDGRLLATSCDDGRPRLWEAADGRPVRTFAGHTNAAFGGMGGVAFSRDGSRLASAGCDWTARVWDVATGRQLRALGGFTVGVNCVAFSPDGRLLAAGDGQTARVWDLTRTPDVLTLRGDPSAVGALAFVPDDSRLLAGFGGGTVAVWDPVTGRPDGQEVVSFRGLTALVSALAFSPGGTCLAAGLTDGTARVWTTVPLSAPRLNGSAWEVVRRPGATAGEYRAALRQADVACQLEPGVAAYRSTLGVAQYRAGRFREAAAKLAGADALRPGLPVNLAFLSLARQRLRQTAAAAAARARLREVLRQPAWARDEQARAFLREAEAAAAGAR